MMALTEIRRGVPEGAEGRVAELYWESFGRKLGPALGPAEAGRAFLAAHLHRDRAVVALREGRVVAVGGYKTADGRGLAGGGAVDVLRAYGPVRGLPRLALLALLERDAARGEMVMDGLAVAPELRGLGIGARLLREVYAVAAEHGCDRLRLDVIDVNPRARALYERQGFRATATQRTPFLRDLMGFEAVTTMHRPLTAADRTPGATS
ncbi:GNAT family N-acetyltransferase [Streptomyces sp. NPDC046866]|uniref:GNAT family N-acetyltransferase n=1 Tax=Streptomyces sp. NPDC046866 TaxID=3154921 RepID=UPI003453BD1D